MIDTLTEAAKGDQGRKCFRLIGGVLVERTVQEVLPALQTNLDGVSLPSPPCARIVSLTLGMFQQLKQILETLLKQYKQKETEMQDFQREYAS